MSYSLNPFDWLIASGKENEGYKLVAKLDGHGGPVNAFAFNAAGTLLASGGDDERVHIWNLHTLLSIQILLDQAHRWGQITCIKFISANTLGTEWLCFGTGRGQFLIHRRNRKSADFLELSNRCIFSSGDSMESFSFDPHFQRVVMSSHYGEVKIFRLEGENLVQLWSDKLSDAIPRAVVFNDNGNLVIIYAMETGVVHVRDCETSTEKYTKSLRSAIGNVSTCAVTGNILIDNMMDGFDLYHPNRSSPSRSFKIESSKKFVRNGVFGEKGKVVVCGSDHGKVYVFAMAETDSPMQVLRHGTRTQMIQTVETMTTQNDNLIATGSSSGKYDIYIWRKSIRRVTEHKERTRNDVHIINLLLVIFITWLTREVWSQALKQGFDEASLYVAKHAAPYLKEVVQEHAPIDAMDHPTLAEKILGMDDEALQKLLGVMVGEKLGDQEMEEIAKE